MAEIAVAPARTKAGLRTAGVAGRLDPRTLAKGPGWTVQDVMCTCGPADRPFDEEHRHVAIAIVTAGTFQYRGSGSNGREMMTPGSILLGSPGQAYQCGHEHGVGDRCLSFHFTPEYFQTIAEGSRAGDVVRVFRSLRLPALPGLSRVVADACAAVGSADVSWEELGIRLAARAVQADADIEPNCDAVSTAAIARVTRAVRLIEEQPTADLTLVRLAQAARLSPFHFLRTFESLTGTTPHQYVRRARLRAAAQLLVTGSTKVLDVALDAGFGDVSNFNHAFRAEFGVSPQLYRARQRTM